MAVIADMQHVVDRSIAARLDKSAPTIIPQVELIHRECTGIGKDVFAGSPVGFTNIKVAAMVISRPIAERLRFPGSRRKAGYWIVRRRLECMSRCHWCCNRERCWKRKSIPRTV